MSKSLKIICLALAIFAALSLIGCGSDPTERDSVKEEDKGSSTEIVTENSSGSSAEISTEIQTEVSSEKPTDTEGSTESATEITTETEPKKETEISTEPEKETEPEKQTEKVTEKATEKVTEKQTEKQTEKETEKVTEKQTEKETEKETVIDPKERYKGMKVICYGDSLTWYDGQNATWGRFVGQPIKGFESYLEEELGMDTVNQGFSGCTIPEICGQLVNNLSRMKTAGMLILSGGDNDDRLGTPVGKLKPVGSTFNTNTTIGAMQNAIEKLLEVRPDIKIVLMTEPIGWKYDASKAVLVRVDEAYPDAIRQVAAQYGLPLIDLWNISGVDESTRDEMYLDPSASENKEYMYHPSNYGWEVISGKIVEFFKNMK